MQSGAAGGKQGDRAAGANADAELRGQEKKATSVRPRGLPRSLTRPRSVRNPVPAGPTECDRKRRRERAERAGGTAAAAAAMREMKQRGPSEDGGWAGRPSVARYTLEATDGRTRSQSQEPQEKERVELEERRLVTHGGRS